MVLKIAILQLSSAANPYILRTFPLPDPDITSVGTECNTVNNCVIILEKVTFSLYSERLS